MPGNFSLPLRAQQGMNFSLFSDDDIRRLSVKRITSLSTFDRMRRRLPNGLYDPSMGSLELDEVCTTCNQTSNDCPGHFGHIELPLPVYHPLFFKDTFLLLRLTCPNCYHLRLSEASVAVIIQKLRYLNEGRLIDACELDLETADIDGFDSNNNVNNKFKLKTMSVYQEWRATVDELLKTQFVKRCPRCRHVCPGLKKDGYAKIIELSLRKSSKASEQIRAAMKAAQAEEDGKDGDGQSESHPPPGKKLKKGKAGVHVGDDGESDEEAAQQEMDEDEDQDDAQSAKHDPRKRRLLNAKEARNRLRRMFKNETELMSLVFGAESLETRMDGGTKVNCVKASADRFFLTVIPVPPSRFRPPIEFAGDILEHPHNTALTEILSGIHVLGESLGIKSKATQLLEDSAQNGQEEDAGLQSDEIMSNWIELQNRVNGCIDSTKSGKRSDLKGIRQTLEKKEGLLRMNMMGKRVNFAARSVISPDPSLDTNQIGLPDVFARKLTYAEPVTPYNSTRLKQAVINGPDVHPGANFVIDERGRKVDLSAQPERARQSIAKQLLRKGDNGRQKVVLRHVIDGDWVLFNRQPTLHKPSMMSHRIRVMYGQKVIRMHYANCSTFNADFDGDEMNVHLLQDELSRTEASEIAHSHDQYIVPTASKPIRGLIQDHVCGGVLMTKLDTTFEWQEYTQLVYQACQSHCPSRLVLLQPTYIKPRRLWTGKQVISTVLHNLNLQYKNSFPITFTSKPKVPGSMWRQHSEEGEVVFHKGHLVTGILDKSQIGSADRGFVHATYEVYGAETAGALLAMLGKLFTFFIKQHGVTCGMKDLVIVAEAEQTRKEVLSTANVSTLEAAARFAGIEEKVDLNDSALVAVVDKALQDKLLDRQARSLLDGFVKQKVSPVTTGVINACLPVGQMVDFPQNMFSLMTTTGAKGSKVNFSQVCCLLGQQELEGQRVPVMNTGKTLPCFQPFETAAISGGFIGSRFLTGLKPQEFYFHCMAGREGLVDTAVKTANSGYLQRCLVKHMESLSVRYDNTVRDGDNSIVQFRYGEDGLDPVKMSGMSWKRLYAENVEAFREKFHADRVEKALGTSTADHYRKTVKKAAKAAGCSSAQARKQFEPILERYPAARNLGVVSEKLMDEVDTYVDTNPDGVFGNGKTKNKKPRSSLASKDEFRNIMDVVFVKSLVEPGEAVGTVAAQSVGEPSTQMTLNTFHSAGQGGNVTLGIPRLREILMTASKTPKTPYMQVPVIEDAARKAGKSPMEYARQVANKLRKFTLDEFVGSSKVESFVVAGKPGMTNYVCYRVTMSLLDKEDSTGIPVKKVERSFSNDFVDNLSCMVYNMVKKMDRHATAIIVEHKEGKGTKGGHGNTDDGVMEEDRKNLSSDNQGKDWESDEDADDNAGPETRGDLKDAEGLGTMARVQGFSYGADEEDVGEDNAGQEEAEGPKPTRDSAASRARSALGVSYEFDEAKLNCCVTVKVKASCGRLMMLEVADSCARKVVVRSVKGIGMCTVMDPPSKGAMPIVMTEGVNFNALGDVRESVQVAKVRSSDIWGVMQFYGVEAGRMAIVEEISNVFGSYGIGVNPRHLTLIADYMSFDGGFRAMNRIGIDNSTSPVLKMSFETTTKFLSEAALYGDKDNFGSPSACIAAGKPIPLGTGAVELLYPITPQ